MKSNYLSQFGTLPLESLIKHRDRRGSLHELEPLRSSFCCQQNCQQTAVKEFVRVVVAFA